MKLKLDENLSRHLKPVLASLGHDVLTAADESLLSRPDTEIAAAAFNEERILLTLDIEFADLRKYPPGTHPGIICSVHNPSVHCQSTSLSPILSVPRIWAGLPPVSLLSILPTFG